MRPWSAGGQARMADAAAKCFNINRRFHRSVMLTSLVNRGDSEALVLVLNPDQPGHISQTTGVECGRNDIAKPE